MQAWLCHDHETGSQLAVAVANRCQSAEPGTVHTRGGDECNNQALWATVLGVPVQCNLITMAQVWDQG